MPKCATDRIKLCQCALCRWQREQKPSAAPEAIPPVSVNSTEWADACQRRMTRAGRLLEAANNAENAAKRMKDAALAEFADARRQLETAQASNDGDMR